MAESFEEFKKNWTIFTEGSLSQLIDWNNVVAAGGSVHACLSPLTAEQKESKRSIRKHYHGVAYPTSDVDLFLWGLTPEQVCILWCSWESKELMAFCQAEAKITQIYEAVRDSVPWDATCIRTKHTVSIHCMFSFPARFFSLRLINPSLSSPVSLSLRPDCSAPLSLSS